MTARVFIVHETLNKNAGRTKNLKPAYKYGEVIHLVQAGLQPDDLSSVLPRMRQLLADFTAEDYIVPIGHPILIGWATAIAASKTGGKAKLLYWNNNTHAYDPMPGAIY